MTYLTMQDRIADELWTVAASSAPGGASRTKLAIQSAIKHYERTKFYFNTKTNTFPTVAAQEYYSSSDLADIATLVQIDAMTVGTDPVKPIPFQDMDDLQDGSVTGDPEFFAYYKQNIRLYPIPTSVRTITMAYVYRLTALSADLDTNAWVTDAEEMIRCRAMANLCAFNTENTERLAIFKAGEIEAYNALISETRKRRSNDLLRVDPAFVAAGRYNIYTDR